MNTIKKISILLFLFITITNTETTLAQVPQGINYQAVIRNSNGDPVVANASTVPQNIHCKVNIYMGNQPGSSGAQLVYEEKHEGITTNNLGIVNFVIGQGDPISSSLFENIDWSIGPYYFELEVDRDGTGTLITEYETYGYQEFVSVPFALHAKVADSIAGVDLNNIGSAGLSAYEIAVQNGFVGTEVEWLASLQGTDGQDGADGLPGQPGADGQDGADGLPGQPGADGQDGADGLSAYEIAVQNGFVGTEAEWLASLQGTDGQDGADGQGGVTQAGTNVTITGDGTPSTPYIIDAIQTISTNGSPGNLSLNDGGGTITINVNDGDDSATNEIQDISTDGSPGNISISNGSTISINVDDADPDPFNEITTVIDNGNGTSTIADVLGGSVTVDNDGIDNVDDADNDPTNELNTGATFNNNILEIQDAGGAVTADLSALDNSGTDDQNASEVFYDNTISGLGGNEVQSAIDQLALDMTTNGVATIRQYTNSDFLSDCATLGSGTWQTIAVIPGISAQSSQVNTRASYAKFQLYDYSAISGGGRSQELLEFNVSRFWDDGQIQLLNHNVPSTTPASIKIEKIRLQYGKVSVGGGSVDCANIQIYRSHTCGNQNNATTNIFVKMTNQIPLTETPLVIIPMELTSTPLSLTNITTDEINILNNNGDDVNDADADPNNEIQDLTLDNNILSLSQSNESVDLSQYLEDPLWIRNSSESHLYPTNLSDNIGLGTNAPSTKLDVVGVLELSNVLPTDPGSDIVRLGDGGTQLQVQTNYGYTRIGPSNSSYAHFYTDRPKYFFDKRIILDEGILSSYNEDLSLQTSQIERMRISNTNGNVGIGTTDLSYKLVVNAGGSSSIAKLNGTNRAYLDIFGGQSQLRIGEYAFGYVGFSNGSESLPHMHISSSGNVGIGNNSGNNFVAQVPLDVEGKTRVGWRGYSDKIWISATDLVPSKSTSDWEILDGGNTMRIYDGSDGYFTTMIPAGYQVVDVNVHFKDNACDRIYIHSNSADWDVSGSSQNGMFPNGNANTNVPCTVNPPIQGGDGRYITIRLENYTGYQFTFTGAYIQLEKCTTGCGM